MLERYFARPKSWDRIRSSWIGPTIERYVEWLSDRRYSCSTIRHDVRVVREFGQFAATRGATASKDLPQHVDAFVEHRFRKRGRHYATERARRNALNFDRTPVEQMLRLAVPDFDKPQHPRLPLPFLRQAPGFFPYLRDERGLRPETLRHYTHYLRRFEQHLTRIKLTDLADLTPVVITGFITESAKMLATASIHNLTWTLRALLRFLHRGGTVDRDLIDAVEAPLIYRDAKLPRSITWAEVRRVLAVVDRRDAVGRRDYAILLLLVSYGLRAGEIQRLTLDDIDWRHGRLRIAERKAGNSTSYPLSDSVGEAIAAYLKEGRPACNCRQVFLSTRPPFVPATVAVVYQCAKRYLRAAGVSVPRPGSHTFRHTCVQRLIDVGMPLHTAGEYVGHRSPQATRVYGKVSVETLREVALGDGEAIL